MTRSRARAKVVAFIALSMVAALLPSRVLAAGASDLSTRPARLTSHLPHGAVMLGALDDSQPLTFEVVLEPSHPDQLSALLDAQRDPTSAEFGHYLAPGQFVQQFGPGPEQVAAVTTWLQQSGLADVSVDDFAVKVRTTARAAADALGISLVRIRTPDNESSFSSVGTPLVPASLAGSISAILGLSNVAAARPRLDAQPAASPMIHAHATPNADGLTPCAAANTAAGSSFFTPDEVGALYGVGALLNQGQTGTGKTVAAFELAPHSPSNTQAFLTCFGLTNSITTTKVDGGGTPDSGGSNGTLEANIDIEEIAAQSPGAAIISYEGPNTGSGEYDTYHKIFTDDTATSVSVSWGLCEVNTGASFMGQLNPLFAQAAAQGQTVVAASGDNGSEDCFAAGNGSTALAVDSPASDPNVTGVGGTSLQSNGNEPVWNDCTGQATYVSCGGNGGAGGGGLSGTYTRPSWQPFHAGGSCSLSTCREVPDVAANAGTGEIFHSGGAWVAVGGTSIAAPKIAGIVADVTTACTARLGDIAPKLVTLAAGNGYTTSVNDVSVGNNDLSRTHSNAFTATTGFDLATGVGAPIASGWSCPQVSSISANAVAPGTSVTITGFGLSDATIKFGSATATITSRSPTSATVVVPAGTGVVTVSGTNAMGKGTTTATFTYAGTVTTTTTTMTTSTTTTTTATTVPPTTPTTVRPTRPTPKPAPVNTRAYRMVAADGGIFSFGGAPFYGSTGAIHLNQPIVGMTSDTATGGYWFVAADGGIFGFHAPYYGSAAGQLLDAPIVGMASTPGGRGYWLTTARGTVFAFGNAAQLGSVGALHAPVVGIAPTHDGRGYWLAGSDGSVYAFGDAHDYGQMFGTVLTEPIVGISADVATGGYWMVATDGGIFGFHAPFYGSTGAIRLNQPIVGIAPTANGAGYWMVARDGGIFTFANARFSGSTGAIRLNQPVVGMASAS